MCLVSQSRSDGASTGTITQTTAGVTKTSDFVTRDQWNGDSIRELAPTKHNSYRIEYEYLGGHVFYYVETARGEFKLVHTIQWANNNSQPMLENPSLRCGLYATSIGATTSVEVLSASMESATEGQPNRTRNPRATDNVKSIGTSMTNVLTLRCKQMVNGLVNQVELQPLQLSMFTESNKGATFEIYGNL